MNDCIFCKIIHKEVPSLQVYEDDDTIGFLELTPSAPGHSMIIHKKHGKSIHDYSQEELGKIMSSVEKLAQKIETSLNCNSITIGINHLEKKGVPHLHVHLVPRWESDHGHVIQGVVQNKSQESRETIAEKIRKA